METETQAKDRTTVNREIAVSAATKVITSNKIMETLTVVKVEPTVVTQEADPVTITAKGEETKTETETTTDKVDTNKTIETKTMATPNADTTRATKSNAEKMRHIRLTPSTKAMMDKTLTFQTKAMTMSLTMNLTLPTKSFMIQTRPMMRKKMTNLSKIQIDKSMISYAAEDNEDTELMIESIIYQDDLFPLQGELLNTKTAKPTVTLIQKQEIDYHPEIVLAIPKDPQVK
jgi:hypothetical protein